MRKSTYVSIAFATILSAAVPAAPAMADVIVQSYASNISKFTGTYFAPILSVLLIVFMLMLLETGRRLGRRRAETEPEESRRGAGLIEAAVFGLLGLLLAFQFAGAGSRLDKRRDIIVHETNAIGTAYLRLDVISAESAAPIRKLFRDYVDARISVFRKLPDIKAAEAELEFSKKLQKEIWSLAVAAVKKEPTAAPTILLLPALNEMIDITTTRTVSALTHMPLLIMALLITMALLSALLAGYAMAAGKKHNIFHMVMFALAISITIYAIIDLEFPRAGFIRIGAADKAMVELSQSMK